MLRLRGGLLGLWLCGAVFAGQAHAQTSTRAPAPAPITPAVPAAAAAEPAESAEYRAAIDDAVRAFSNQDWPAARVAFGRAHTLSPSARTCRGVGLSLFYLRDYVAARIAFEQALAETRKPLSSEQRDELQRFLGSAKLETGRYELHVTPPSAQVTIDAMPRPAGGAVILARGNHELVANADGFNERRTNVLVNGGEDTALELKLTATVAAVTPGTLAVAQPESDSKSVAPDKTWPAPDPALVSGEERPWTWLIVGAIAAPVLAGTGAGIWAVGKNKHDEIGHICDVSTCDRARVNRLEKSRHISSYTTWSTVSFVAAGAALVTSIVLYVVTGTTSPTVESAKQAGPPMLSVGPTGATFTAQF